MKNIKQIIFGIAFICLLSAISANAQITSVSQLKDVKSTDKHYDALQSLIERYGVFEPFPDYTFRANEPLTRGQFAFLLSRGLDRLVEIGFDEDDEIVPYELFNNYSANKTNLTSVSQLKDIRPTNEYYVPIQSLIEHYGIDIADADKNFRPEKSVTEKEFYTWISEIFGATIGGNPSPTKALTRSEFVMVMNQAFDSVYDKIEGFSEKKESDQKAEIIKNFTSKGKAQIVKKGEFYLPDNPCADLSGASADLKEAVKDGGIWGDYKVNNGDIGEIIYETNNTCAKGKVVLLRIGTAIVTIGEKGIKRLK